MPIEAYEEEVLFQMYDNEIIGYKYFPVQKIASIIKWKAIAKKYKVKKKFSSVIKHLINKGYIDGHGKSGDVASLSKLGVDYVLGKRESKLR